MAAVRPSVLVATVFLLYTVSEVGGRRAAARSKETSR